jgi:predicted DNA-binding antitoxin AbrB/MazE fold protein
MRPVRARYENGSLLPAKPLPLRAGEHVALIFMREPDPARWQLERLAAHAEEDLALADAGLAEWGDALDREDG